MKRKIIVLLLTMAVGLLVPPPMKAQHDSYTNDVGLRAGLLNHGLVTEGGFTHQSFGNGVDGGFMHQSFGNSVDGGFTHQSFGNGVGGGFTHQSFGNGVDGGFTHQGFGNGVDGDFTHQSFGNGVGGGFTHQPFGSDAPLGSGILILLSAGMSYAALKKTRQNNEQQ